MLVTLPRRTPIDSLLGTSMCDTITLFAWKSSTTDAPISQTRESHDWWFHRDTRTLEYVKNAPPTCLPLMLTPNAPLQPGKTLDLLCYSDQVGVHALQDRTRIAESHLPQGNARQQRKQRMAKE